MSDLASTHRGILQHLGERGEKKTALAVMAVMDRMESFESDLQWVGNGQTVFEALWEVVCNAGLEEELKSKFPQYT